jgi:hypothetical protein
MNMSEFSSPGKTSTNAMWRPSGDTLIHPVEEEDRFTVGSHDSVAFGAIRSFGDIADAARLPVNPD